MSDLTDELLHMAAEGAGQARPLAVAEVIRRGNHRRVRAIAQRSVGGLSALGVSAAVIFAGVSHGSVAPSSSSAHRGDITLTETTSSAAGTMTVEVNYRAERHDTLKLLSITFAGDSHVATRRALLAFDFGPVLGTQDAVHRSGGRGIGFGIVLRLSDEHRFAGSVPHFLVASTSLNGPLRGAEVLRVNLQTAVRRGKPSQLLTAGLVMNH